MLRLTDRRLDYRTQRRVVAVLLVGAALGAGCSIRAKKYGLAHYVGGITKPEYTDCGSFQVYWGTLYQLHPAARASLTQCISTARREHRPFYFVLEGPSIDSHFATGLIGDPAGSIRRFWYDSAPCGGPGCPERFTITGCVVPPTEDALDPEMKCQSKE